MILGVVHIEIIPRCSFFGQNPVFGMSAFWPKHPKMRLEPATCLQHPPISTFTCTTNPYAYTQRIWECVIQFWLSYSMFGFYRVAGTHMTDFSLKSVQTLPGIFVKDALLHETKWFVSFSVLLRSHACNLGLVRAV